MWQLLSDRAALQHEDRLFLTTRHLFRGQVDARILTQVLREASSELRLVGTGAVKVWSFTG
jgi:hypothetical protein